MKYLSKLIFILPILFLFNFHAFAQSNVNTQGRDASQKVMNDFKQEYLTRDEFKILRGKIPVMPKEVNIEQLANATKPNNIEKKSLQAYSELRKKFEIAEMEVIDKYYSYVAPLRLNYHREVEGVLIDLYTGKITFGQFNKKNQEIADNFTIKVQSLNAEKRSNIDAAKRNQQKETTCTKLRAQLNQKIEEQNSFTSRLQDAQAHFSGGAGGPVAGQSARAAQKSQAQDQINQMQQYIISYCGSL
jgi:hypothetical protein